MNEWKLSEPSWHGRNSDPSRCTCSWWQSHCCYYRKCIVPSRAISQNDKATRASWVLKLNSIGKDPPLLITLHLLLLAHPLLAPVGQISTWVSQLSAGNVAKRVNLPMVWTATGKLETLACTYWPRVWGSTSPGLYLYPSSVPAYKISGISGDTSSPISPSVLNFNCFFSLRYWCCWKHLLVFLFFLNLSGEKIRWSMLVVDSLTSWGNSRNGHSQNQLLHHQHGYKVSVRLLREIRLHPCIGLTQQPTQWMSSWYADYADHTTTCQEHQIIDGISWETVDW